MIKRIVGPMMDFKWFWCTANVLAGIETMHMIKKGQLDCADVNPRPPPTGSTRWLIEQQ